MREMARRLDGRGPGVPTRWMVGTGHGALDAVSLDRVPGAGAGPRRGGTSSGVPLSGGQAPFMGTKIM